MRTCLAALALLLILAPHWSFAQKLTVVQKSGLETTDPLSDIRKLYFSGGQLLVDFKTGTDDSYLLEDVQKLYFDAAVSVVDQSSSGTSTLTVFPNPAGDRITVSGIAPAGGKLNIYRIDGAMVISRDVSSGQEVLEIGSLSSGLYVISVTGMTVKFVKK